MPRPLINRIGERYGKLIVVEQTTKGKARPGSAWLCKCDCGKTIVAYASELKRGTIKACGCLRGVSHGKNYTKEHRAFLAAKRRCTNPNFKYYYNYGGRGIEFKFVSFDDWFRELGLAPTPKHTVDRINVDGHYEIGNVRWATRKEQNNNVRMRRV
jgi:hypothetical protein